MKLITHIFMVMAPNKKVIFIKSFIKAMRTLKVASDCKVYHRDEGQYIHFKKGNLYFGYEKDIDRSHDSDCHYSELQLNAALMHEFEHLFTIFIEHFAATYDTGSDHTIALS